MGHKRRMLRLPFPRALLMRLKIVYVSIMAPVMLAAFLEWFLFIAAFDYCLVKVFQKAESTSIKVLSMFIGISFTLLRYGPLLG